MRRLSLLPLIAVGLISVASAQEKPKYDMKICQLVFLAEPKVKPSKEKATATMEQHLAFLEGIWKERKALLVGPLMDAGARKGLVVLDVRTKAEAEEIMKNEPFVKEGSLEMETYSWFVARNVPQQAPKFLDIEPYWFGTLTRQPGIPKLSDEEANKIQEGHMANINKMAESGDLVLAGPIAEGGDFRGIFIFRTADKEKIKELVSHDPTISGGRLRLDLYQWMTSKGTFAKAK